MNIKKMELPSKRSKTKRLLPAMVCKDWNSNDLFIHKIERAILVRPQSNQSNMSEVGLMTKPERTPTEYTAPKRYESTCYFMPLAVPVWYSSSVSMKVNSTKRTYKETVNYQKKLVPYRFVETMTTVTAKTPQPVFFVSDLNILREVPEEHYLSLEDQQTAASDKPFATNHHINIENHA